LGTCIRLAGCVYPKRKHPARLLQEIGEAPSQRAEDLHTGGLRRLGSTVPYVLFEYVELFRRTGEIKPSPDFLQPANESLTYEFFQQPYVNTSWRTDCKART
jgi:hypothetical protein